MSGATQTASRIRESVAELAQIVGRSICEAMVCLRPDVLGRIEFRGVRGEVVHMELRMSGQEVPDFTPAMNRAAIPKQVDRAAQVAQQVTEEGLDIEAGEIVGATPEVEGDTPAPGRYHQGATDRQPVMPVAMPDTRGLPLRGPGAVNIRDQQEPALIGTPRTAHRGSTASRVDVSQRGPIEADVPALVWALVP